MRDCFDQAKTRDCQISPATKTLHDRAVTKDTAPPRQQLNICARLSRRSLCVGYVLFTRPIMVDAAGGKYRCSSRNASAIRTSLIALSGSRRPISTSRREFRIYVTPSASNRVKLRRACQAILGMTPVSHLQTLRLSEVRRTLSTQDGAASTITAVASRFGFHELGRFAAVYRAAFGEHPSETRRSCPIPTRPRHRNSAAAERNVQLLPLRAHDARRSSR